MNDELLVSYLLEEAPPGLRDKVERWISANPAHQRYFDHFQLIWETSRQAIGPPEVNEEEAWQRFQQRTIKAAAKPAVVRSLSPAFKWMRAAAVLILSIGALTLSYFIWNRSSATPVTIASSGTSIEKTLPDGSTIALNKNSSVTYDRKMKGDKRKIKLKGEAFFTVTPDKTKPFVVEAGDITITVVGTSFNVKNIHEETEIIVETGIVKVTRNNKTITLKPHEKVIIKQTDSLLKKQETTDKLYNYYRSKEFVCDNTPLWKLVETLNEAYNVTIIIEKPELRSYPITTTFYNESLDNILSVIAETFNISVERNKNAIILK